MNPIPAVEFGNKLRSYREARGLSVREVAKLADASSSLISALENGRRSAGVLTVKKLSAALKLSAKDAAEFVSLSASTRGASRLQPGTRRKGLQSLEMLVAGIVGVEPGEIREIFMEAKLHGRQCYDLVVQLHSKQIFGIDFSVQKNSPRIYVVPGNGKGELPDSKAARSMPGTKVVTTADVGSRNTRDGKPSSA